jgi:hypothetical protein
MRKILVVVALLIGMLFISQSASAQLPKIKDSKAETTAGAHGKRATGGGQRNATISAAA